ncbi:MAG: type I-D CRISPR-associated protein Cas10d/Csc3, partial [Anaerolineae bacterium]
YKGIVQYGAKAGQTLYSHVLNGVFLLAQLQQPLELEERELQVLFAAYTIHDLNKLPEQKGAMGYNKLATPERVAQELHRVGMERFFPEMDDYLDDIVTLARAHSGHHHVAGELLLASHDPYGLGRKRVQALAHLMKAVDVVDLSHTLLERRHKRDFLRHLNTFTTRQYDLYRHRLAENRGLLSNVLHNAIVEHLRETRGLTPLLFYPDGVVYLQPTGSGQPLEEQDLEQVARRASEAIADMTKEQLSDFVESKPGGIAIQAKCLQLGASFREIWRAVRAKAGPRASRADPDDIEDRTRARIEKNMEKNAEDLPQMVDTVRQGLDSDEPLIADTETGIRIAELLRAYYVMVKDLFPDLADDPWHHVYRLLDVPEERWDFYEYTDARWDRCYVLVGDIPFSEEEINERFIADGQRLLEERVGADPRIPLFRDYLARYAIFGDARGERRLSGHLAHYVENQHRQCVMCSSVFPTDNWMTGDVREDITVQAFSNRLRGGPGDPKKYVCELCRLQFLLEKLDYPSVREENLVYLHLFPYSFHTQPFIEGLREAMGRLQRERLAERALFLPRQEMLKEADMTDPLKVAFRGISNAGNPYSYGLYMARYSSTVGNRIIFPLNPAGSTDSERFLFALWNAMTLQRYFGCKVLLSDSPVAPLDKEDFDDLYIASVPLACRGLVIADNYAAGGDPQDPTSLEGLWEGAWALHTLARDLRTQSRQDEMLALVRAMGRSGLFVYYEAEKLLEARAGGQSGGLVGYLSRRALPHVETLAHSIGGRKMAELSKELERLAEIAWEGGLRGRSLRKNSLIMPLDEVFTKLNLRSEAADIELLRAAAVEDIFEHLQRIADPNYPAGRRKLQATQAFVDRFFERIFEGIYDGKLRKLLADEKLLRSAFLFYVRQQIPGGKGEEEDEAA